MRKSLFLVSVITTLLAFFNIQSAYAQTDAGRVELGGQFALMHQSNTGPAGTLFVREPSRWDPGIGGRIAFNLIDSISLEAEMNFFPREEDSFGRGEKTQGLFGVKGGHRFDEFGVFGKVRPGFMRFGHVENCPTGERASCRVSSRTQAALDIGAVFEYYPSRRTSLRFDVGKTIIWFDGTIRFVPFLEAPGGFLRVPIPGNTVGNLQMNIGVGFRF